MQEEVENKSVAISIKATKLTANVLKAALLKALEEMEKKQKKSQDPQGQTECETPCPAGGWGQQHRNHGRQHQVF